MSDLPQRHLCGAKTRDGSPCEAYPITGRTRCKLHGGASLRGIDHPSFRGRGYSKDIPQRYLERLVASQEDPGLAGMRQELGLLDARLGEILESIDGPSLADRWKEVLDGLHQAQVALYPSALEQDEEGNLRIARETVGRLVDECRLAIADSRSWKEVYEVVDLRRRVAQAETKREEVMSATLTAKQAGALVATIRSVIDQVLSDDPGKRDDIYARIFGAAQGAVDPPEIRDDLHSHEGTPNTPLQETP